MRRTQDLPRLEMQEKLESHKLEAPVTPILEPDARTMQDNTFDDSDTSKSQPAATVRRLFSHLTQEEQPKEVIHYGKASALLHFALFPAPAIVITVGLYSIHILGLQWKSGHPTSNELSALLFAAKVHESFIIVSLTDILLHRIQYGLLGNDGLALGYLSSVFQMGSPIRYLVSWEFWGTLLNPTRNRMFHGITGATIIFIALLSIGASPFSATAMIPRLGWWETPFDDGVTDLYLANNLYSLEPASWPTLPFALCDTSLSPGNDD